MALLDNHSSPLDLKIEKSKETFQDWVVSCVQLPGCFGVAETIAEALQVFLEAAEAYLSVVDPVSGQFLDTKFKEALQETLGEDVEVLDFEFEFDGEEINARFSISHENSRGFLTSHERNFRDTVEQFAQVFFNDIAPKGKLTVNDVWSSSGKTSGLHCIYLKVKGASK